MSNKILETPPVFFRWKLELLYEITLKSPLGNDLRVAVTNKISTTIGSFSCSKTLKDI